MKLLLRSSQWLLLCLLLMACAPQYTKTFNTPQTSVAIAQVAPDKQFTELVQPYKIQLDSQLNTVIGECAILMPQQFNVYESLIGNWGADALLYSMRQRNINADFAFTTMGSLRVDIQPAPITVGTMFELMPFENETMLLHMKGSTVKKLLTYLYQNKNVGIAGVKVVFTNGILTEASINGKPLEDEAIYQAITSDYLGRGGDKMSFITEDKTTAELLGVKVRDLYIAYVQQHTAAGKKISAQLEGRIIVQ